MLAYWIVATSQSHTYSIRLCLPVNSLVLLCVRAHGYSFVNVCVFCLFISFYARCYALLQGCNHILTNANKTVFFKKIRFFGVSTNEEAPTLNAHQNIFSFLQNYRQLCWNRQAHIVSYCQQRKIKYFFFFSRVFSLKLDCFSVTFIHFFSRYKCSTVCV